MVANIRIVTTHTHKYYVGKEFLYNIFATNTNRFITRGLTGFGGRFFNSYKMGKFER